MVQQRIQIMKSLHSFFRLGIIGSAERKVHLQCVDYSDLDEPVHVGERTMYGGSKADICNWVVPLVGCVIRFIHIPVRNAGESKQQKLYYTRQMPWDLKKMRYA